MKNKNKGKLQIWTEAISNAYKEMRQANNNWYEAGKTTYKSFNNSVKKEM